MKRVKKVLAMVMVLSLMAVSIVGCTANEIELMESFIKMAEMNSYENTSTLEINFSGETSEEELQEIFDNVAMYLDGFKLVANTKTWSNEESTKAKTASNYELNLGDTEVKLNLWTDVDFSGEDFLLNIIFDIPQILSESLLGEEYAEKYIVINYGNMFDIMFEEMGLDSFEDLVDYSNITEEATKILEMLFNYIKSSATNLDMGTEFVTKKGTETTSRGESATKYEVKLDDAAFKTFMEAIINDVILQDKTLDFIKEYMEFSMGLVNYDAIAEAFDEEIDQDEILDEVMLELDEAFAEVSKEFPEYRKAVTEAFKVIKDLKILGEDGITSTYYVNNDGYVVEAKHAIDIELDIAEILGLAYGMDDMEFDIAEDVDADEEVSGKIKIGINYETSNYNINQEIDIEIPEITDENSIDLMEELIASFGGPDVGGVEFIEPPVKDGINVLLNGGYIEFPDVVPQNIEGRVLVPIRTISEEMGAEVLYEHETRTVTIIDGDNTIILNIGETTAYINDVENELDVPANVIDGRTMVPIRFVSEAMDSVVEWDGDTKTVIIFKF